MSKRKYSDLEALEASNPSGTSSLKRQKRNVVAALDDGKKQLFRALKFARGFERQKLGRRQKSSRMKRAGQDLDRLEAEVAALKNLDLAATAETYLCRYLMKTRAIAEHSALPSDVKSKAAQPVPKDAAYANVTARMYKSNPVTEAIDKTVGTIRRTLGLRAEEIKPKKRMRKADYEAAALAGSEAPAAESAARSDEDELRNFTADQGTHGAPEATVPSFDSGDSFDGFSDIEVQDQESRDVSADELESDFAQYDARIASSSDGEEDDGSEDTNASQLYSKNLGPAVTPPAGSTSRVSVSVSLSPSLSPEPRSRRQPDNGFFLPGLNTGYISGSDSDASEISDAAPPKRNRLGQRARQAMWEKKYGHDARHIQKGAKPVMDRDQGWDSKRGATGSDRQKPWGKRDVARPRERPVPGRSRPQRGPEKPPEKVPTYGSAHPSWIAKQQAKEKAATMSKPAGKKITFD